MTFALCLQLPNHFRLKRRLDIYTNFLPQMLFLQSIFGYLVVCILYKWSIDWTNRSTEPPSLLNMLIAMFLSPGTVDPRAQLYPGQGFVQAMLLLLAVICVPWMLCAKPYFEWKELQKIHRQGYVGLDHHDGPRQSSDEIMEIEEEGNGRTIIEEMEEGHVGDRLLQYGLVADFSFRNNMSLVMLSSTRSFTPSSFVWDVYLTRPRTCDCGHFPWLMPSCLKCCGR